MALQFTTSYLQDSMHLFRYYKKLADGALRRVTDEQICSCWTRTQIPSRL